jgi:hypothetical protein
MKPASCTPSAPGTAKAAPRTALPRASSISASTQLTGWPRKWSASHTSPAPSDQAPKRHTQATAKAPRRP